MTEKLTPEQAALADDIVRDKFVKRAVLAAARRFGGTDYEDLESIGMMAAVRSAARYRGRYVLSPDGASSDLKARNAFAIEAAEGAIRNAATGDRPSDRRNRPETSQLILDDLDPESYSPNMWDSEDDTGRVSPWADALESDVEYALLDAPREMQGLYRMKVTEELTDQEVADRLGVSLRTAKRRWSDAKSDLYHILGDIALDYDF